MTLMELLASGGGIALLAMSLVEISPIKLNPWSWIAKNVGRAINADVLRDLEEIKKEQKQTQERLDEHIQTDDERAADGHRANILRFNCELLQNRPHTREDFIEVLNEIDKYDRYCKAHPTYPNSRAVHAIANIERVYDERLQKHDFM